MFPPSNPVAAAQQVLRGANERINGSRLSTAVQQMRDAMPVQGGEACKWCNPPKNAAVYPCTCAGPCSTGNCPLVCATGAISDGCAIPVDLPPVPVFRASDA